MCQIIQMNVKGSGEFYMTECQEYPELMEHCPTGAVGGDRASILVGTEKNASSENYGIEGIVFPRYIWVAVAHSIVHCKLWNVFSEVASEIGPLGGRRVI